MSENVLELKQEIRRVFDKLDGPMCERAMDNFTERTIVCKASREGGGHVFSHIWT